MTYIFGRKNSKKKCEFLPICIGNNKKQILSTNSKILGQSGHVKKTKTTIANNNRTKFRKIVDNDVKTFMIYQFIKKIWYASSKFFLY